MKTQRVAFISFMNGSEENDWKPWHGIWVYVNSSKGERVHTYGVTLSHVHVFPQRLYYLRVYDSLVCVRKMMTGAEAAAAALVASVENALLLLIIIFSGRNGTTTTRSTVLLHWLWWMCQSFAGEREREKESCWGYEHLFGVRKRK